MTNTSKIKGKIAEKGYTFTSFAEAVNISRPALRKKINDIVDFKASEIERVCSVLDITRAEISDYFFTLDVAKTETTA